MPPSTPAVQRAVFEDGLGKRHHAKASNGELLEVLELREEFATDGFEFALRERVSTLAGLHTTWFSHVRTVQRVKQKGAALFVVSNRVEGTRLSTLLAARQQPLEVNATLYLIRQLAAAVALLHEKLPGVGHGAISSERVIITPDARVVVADHVFGSALEQHPYSPAQYWKELHLALPLDRPSFDQRADVMQIGTLALELILGRRIEPAEYPHRFEDVAEQARQATEAAVAPLPPEFHAWLRRMLQLEASEAFPSAVDAWADLEDMLGASDFGATFVTLESVLADSSERSTARHLDASAQTAEPEPEPESVSPEMSAEPPSAMDDTAASRELPAEHADEAAGVLAASPIPAAPLSRFDLAFETPAEPPTFSRLSAFDPPPAPAPAPAPAEPFALNVSFAAPQDEVKRTPSPTRTRWMAAAAVVVLLAGAGAVFGRQYLLPSASAEAPGTLVVTTNPAGYQVFIDGQPRGVTPLTIELRPGAHELKIATEGEPRIIPFTVAAGSTVAQTLEIPRAAPLTGQLMVHSEPAGARVMIADTLRGTTPLTIEGLTPGTLSVTLQNDISAVTQEVLIEPGVRASLVVPMTPPQNVPVSGWVSVVAPTEMQVFEDGRLLGTSQTDRIMISAGSHNLDLVNEALGYRVRRSVAVVPGKVTPIRLEWPNGTLALNAQPWAEVWVNGKPLGETPIGSVEVPIGTHQVIFRHPQLGERVVHATVTATAPARVTVDLRKP